MVLPDEESIEIDNNDLMTSLNKKSEYSKDNIDDICAKDSLTDTNGLTVILPDKKFMNRKKLK